MRFLEVKAGDTSSLAFAAGTDDWRPVAATMRGDMMADRRLDGEQFTSWTFGSMVVAAGALDPFTDVGELIFVGSDEGYTTETLVRLAELCADLLRFLGFGSNVPMLPLYSEAELAEQKDTARRCLNYVFLQMEQQNLSFLLEGTPKNRLLMIDVGFKGLDDLVAGLHELYYQTDDCTSHIDCPGYACVFLGDRLIEESGACTVQRARDLEASRVNATYRLSQGDKFLLHIVVAACGYPKANLVGQNQALSEREATIFQAEQLLWHQFGLRRDNIRENASARAALDLYLQHLEEEDRSETALGKAASIRSAVDAIESNLQKQVEEDLDPSMCSAADAIKLENPIRPCFHRTDIPQSTASRMNIRCSLNAQVPRIRVAADASEIIAESANPDSPARKHQEPLAGLIQIVRVPMPEEAEDAWRENECVFGTGPHGVDLGLLFFPKMVKEQPFFVWDERLEDMFKSDYGDHIAWQHYSVDFFQHPAMGVECRTPRGLQYYCYVDRATNTTTCCNPEWLAMSLVPDGGPVGPEVKKAITGIHSMMRQSISRAHGLMTNGYQEGLWGHLGFQFYYKVFVTETKMAVVDDVLKMPKESQLDSNVFDTMTRNPYRLADETKKFVSELYCIFIGSMTPKEVSDSIPELMRFLREYDARHESVRVCGCL